MRPEPLRRDERPLEMRADDVRCGAVLRNLVQRRRQLVLGRRDEGRLIGGHTAREQRFARSPVTLSVGREEVDAREPVDLQVDETRSSDSGSVRRTQADSRDLTVGNLDVAGNEPALDERGLYSQSHDWSNVPRWPSYVKPRDRRTRRRPG